MAIPRKIQSAGVRTAVVVMQNGHVLRLCPLFAKCDGVLLIEPDGSRTYYPNAEGIAQCLSELVLNARCGRLLCGFIGSTEKEALQRAGIDIRLGSCACSVDELVGAFSTLPEA